MWLKSVKHVLRNAAGDETSFATGAAPVASAEPATESTDSDVNWSGLDSEFDENEEGSGTVEGDLEVVPNADTEPTPAGAQGTPPAATPPAAAPAPATAPTADQAPTPAPAAPAAPAPQPSAPQGEASPQPSYQDWRAQKETDLASNTYSINEEDASKLLTEPETVLPRMAARMHMEVMESAMRAMQVMLPQMMQSIQHSTQVETSAKNLFHSANPDLVDPSLEPAILEMGTVYRRLNQNASPEVAAVAIGNLVRASLGIAMPQAASVPTKPATPTAVPFVPARGGSGAGAPSGATDVWGQLAEELLSDDK